MTSQRLKVLLPLYGQQIFLLGIAILARGDDVSFLAFSAPAEGNHVIHSQVFPAYLFPAIMTPSLLNLFVPPVGPSKGSRLFFFSSNLPFTDGVHMCIRSLFTKGMRLSVSLQDSLLYPFRKNLKAIRLSG